MVADPDLIVEHCPSACRGRGELPTDVGLVRDQVAHQVSEIIARGDLAPAAACPLRLRGVHARRAAGRGACRRVRAGRGGHGSDTDRRSDRQTGTVKIFSDLSGLTISTASLHMQLERIGTLEMTYTEMLHALDRAAGSWSR
jgi:hypothetical protein